MAWAVSPSILWNVFTNSNNLANCCTITQKLLMTNTLKIYIGLYDSSYTELSHLAYIMMSIIGMYAFNVNYENTDGFTRAAIDTINQYKLTRYLSQIMAGIFEGRLAYNWKYLFRAEGGYQFPLLAVGFAPLIVVGFLSRNKEFIYEERFELLMRGAKYLFISGMLYSTKLALPKLADSTLVPSTHHDLKQGYTVMMNGLGWFYKWVNVIVKTVSIVPDIFFSMNLSRIPNYIFFYLTIWASENLKNYFGTNSFILRPTQYIEFLEKLKQFEVQYSNKISLEMQESLTDQIHSDGQDKGSLIAKSKKLFLNHGLFSSCGVQKNSQTLAEEPSQVTNRFSYCNIL